jgi:hypothetical protein
MFRAEHLPLTYSCRKQFSTRQILNAKLPEPGGGSTVEQSDYED